MWPAFHFQPVSSPVGDSPTPCSRLFPLCNPVMPTFHLWQHSSHFIAITSLFFFLRAGIMTMFFTTVLDHSRHLINLWVGGWLVVICCLLCPVCSVVRRKGPRLESSLGVLGLLLCPPLRYLCGTFSGPLGYLPASGYSQGTSSGLRGWS